METERKWGSYRDIKRHPRAGFGGALGSWGPKGSEQGMRGQIWGGTGMGEGDVGTASRGTGTGGDMEKRMGDMVLILRGYGMGHKGTKLEGLRDGGGVWGQGACVQRWGALGQNWGDPGTILEAVGMELRMQRGSAGGSQSCHGGPRAWRVESLGGSGGTWGRRWAVGTTHSAKGGGEKCGPNHVEGMEGDSGGLRGGDGGDSRLSASSVPVPGGGHTELGASSREAEAQR